MLRQTLDAVARASPAFRRLLVKAWYEMLVVVDRDKAITFMNYGYSDLNGATGAVALADQEQGNRYCIQLYRHLASPIDPRGKDVVEVGSGRGGGAAHISRELRPKSMIGIDISKKAVDFCNNHYSVDGLSFSQGDAENLPLPDSSVDVVFNLESSHCYGSMPRFLSEVHRVLRPGGYFLYSDHRDLDKIDLLRKELEGSRLKTVSEEDITRNVVRALDLDHDRKKQMIGEKCPKLLRKEVEEFAALKGTRAYQAFNSGSSRYLYFVLQKTDSI
jgi:ubiquinone/menaquinone biosynthesis C-methylase UbiE